MWYVYGCSAHGFFSSASASHREALRSAFQFLKYGADEIEVYKHEDGNWEV